MDQSLFSYQREILSHLGLEPWGSSIKVCNYGMWQASLQHLTWPFICFWKWNQEKKCVFWDRKMLKMWGKYLNLKLSLKYYFVASIVKTTTTNNCWALKKKLLSIITELWNSSMLPAKTEIIYSTGKKEPCLAPVAAERSGRSTYVTGCAH